VTRLLDPPNNRFFHEVFGDADRTIPCPWAGASFETCVPTSGSLLDVLQLDDTWFDPSGVGSFTDFNALLAAFETNGLFLDIHTQLYPGDEIRGQLVFNKVSEPATVLLLSFGLLGLLAPRHRLFNARLDGSNWAAACFEDTLSR
jgi:hypothetical protein